MKHVIQTTDVLSYEQFGFANCVRFGDVLYLSGISALDPQGQVLGSDIETQTIQPIGTSNGFCEPPDRDWIRYCR
jgi:2-iminobutanoate/2-iminopropanoate deaminase